MVHHERAPSDEPTLDDILARDFAELKVGESNLAGRPPKRGDEGSKAVQTTVPAVYNQRIDAVEDRVLCGQTARKESVDDAPAPTTTAPPKVLKSPSAQPGATSMWTGRTLINGRGQSGIHSEGQPRRG